MTLDLFHQTLGQTIMFCQIIENDIKLIYAAMKAGDINKNLKELEKYTLGNAISVLKELDYSDGEAYLSNNDYDFLFKISAIRNHYCHETYLKFVYCDKVLTSDAFLSEYETLKRDNANLYLVFKKIEKVRVQAMKDYNRI